MSFDRQIFACNISSAVLNCSQLNSPLQCSAVLTFRGVKYVKDAFVVIDHNETEIIFGKIVMYCGQLCKVCRSS